MDIERSGKLDTPKNPGRSGPLEDSGFQRNLPNRRYQGLNGILWCFAGVNLKPNSEYRVTA